MKPTDHIDLILELLETRGTAAYLGEPVSQREHALQTAHLAVTQVAPDALVTAALLHDIGHLLDTDTGAEADGMDAPHEDALHEEKASAWLARYFGPEVTEPVRLHVAAKRYLCTVDSKYLQLLSPASLQSLKFQGGLLPSDQVLQFEANPFHSDAIQLRRWDDCAKTPALPVPGLEHYAAMLLRVSICHQLFNESSRS